MDLLYDGMVIPHDIYDADGRLLLLKQGYKINISQIDAIRRHNKNRNFVQVTLETHKLLMENSPKAKSTHSMNPHQERLEEETGYTEIKHEAIELLEGISRENLPKREKIDVLSSDLSHKVDTTKPDKLLDLINALAPVDEYLQRHCINVSLLNGLMGKWLELSKSIVDMLVLTGLVHDCGKAAIPPQILNAPRKLTVTEFEVIKMHTVYSYEMLAEFPSEVRYGARGHHEKFNSGGYPDNLFKNRIPLAAQITAVSDIYDAMVSQRAYKPPKNPFNIMLWIKKLSGIELSEFIVDVFLKCMPKEMVNKSCLLSNGEMGAIHEIDYDDLEHPYLRVGQRVFKSSPDLFCTQMFYGGE
jgi:HD-GYP domain-containing protein (c-di-GMP phosphodiesterase class II)